MSATADAFERHTQVQLVCSHVSGSVSGKNRPCWLLADRATAFDTLAEALAAIAAHKGAFPC